MEEIENILKEIKFHHTETYKGRDFHFYEPENGSNHYFIVKTFTEISENCILTKIELSKQLMNDNAFNYLEYIHYKAELESDKASVVPYTKDYNPFTIPGYNLFEEFKKAIR